MAPLPAFRYTPPCPSATGGPTALRGTAAIRGARQQPLYSSSTGNSYMRLPSSGLLSKSIRCRVEFSRCLVTFTVKSKLPNSGAPASVMSKPLASSLWPSSTTQLLEFYDFRFCNDFLIVYNIYYINACRIWSKINLQRRISRIYLNYFFSCYSINYYI